MCLWKNNSKYSIRLRTCSEREFTMALNVTTKKVEYLSRDTQYLHQIISYTWQNKPTHASFDDELPKEC